MSRMSTLLCRLSLAVVTVSSLFALLPTQPVFADTVAVNSVTDVSDGDTSSISALIANPGSDGVISLREAIIAANNTAGADTIDFNIDGAGVRTIAIAEALPNVTGPTTIDGLTQPGASCHSWPPTLLIELSWTGSDPYTDGLQLRGGNSVVRGLIIHGFSRDGIHIEELYGGNKIECNFIGTNAAGTADLGNNGSGVAIWYAPDNVIGGTAAGTRNLLSGNEFSGVYVYARTATRNLIQGNLIGTDVYGTGDLGNTLAGVAIGDAPGNTIGGTTEAARNIISGNDSKGITISDPEATSNIVQGNYVGTDILGTSILSNSRGVLIENASDNIVGGTVEGARNVISGNGFIGLSIQGTSAQHNVVEGNYIGTDHTGTILLGNGLWPNWSSVNISDFASYNTIGGSAPGARNIIAGGHYDGIRIYESSNNLIQGNYIGTGVTGTESFGNYRCGVSLTSANNNQIGGTLSGEGNLITDNGRNNAEPGAGVCLLSGTGNLISGNSIFANRELGIDLWPEGVTNNDVGDGDSGANQLQNFPVLTSVTFGSDSTTIAGTLTSTANTTFHLEFFYSTAEDPTHHGEGQTFLGSHTVTTDDSGNATFSASFGRFPGLSYVSATATDPNNNTSEFGPVFQTPTAVSLADFHALTAHDRMVLEWTTVSEIDNLGFNVYRAVDPASKPVRLNEDLIPSKAPGSPIGATYEFLDTSVERGNTYYYWLDSVDVYGMTVRHGPVSAAMPCYRHYLPLVRR